MIVKTVSANFIIQAITFATSVLTARILGPVGRGELALVLLYPMLVANLIFMGVDRAVAILGGRGDLARPVNTIMKLVLLFSIPAMMVGYLTVHWRVTDIHLSKLSTLYLIYVPAMYFFMLVVFLFNGAGDFLRFNLARIWFYVYNFALILVVWATAPASLLDSVVLANLVSVYGAMATAVWFLRRHKLPVVHAVEVDQNEVRAVIGVAAFFAPAVMLANFSGAAYQILLEHFMGVGPLGLFVVYFSYSRLLSPVGSAIGSHLFHLGIAGEKMDIARICRQSLLVYLVCAIPLWLIAGWLIPMVFGRDFAGNIGAICLLFVSCLFALTADSLTEFLKGRQKVAADIIGRMIYLIFLGILGWGLLPSIGLIGLSLALAVSDLLRCGYLVSRVSREMGLATGEFWRITRVDLTTVVHAGGKVLQRFSA